MSGLFAPLPVFLAQRVAEGKPLAVERLIFWALVLSRSVEQREKDSIRDLAGMSGLSRGEAHRELEKVRAWVEAEAPALVLGRFRDRFGTKLGHVEVGTPGDIDVSRDDVGTELGRLVRAGSSYQSESADSENNPQSPHGGLERECDHTFSSSPCLPSPEQQEPPRPCPPTGSSASLTEPPVASLASTGTSSGPTLSPPSPAPTAAAASPAASASRPTPSGAFAAPVPSQPQAESATGSSSCGGLSVRGSSLPARGSPWPRSSASASTQAQAAPPQTDDDAPEQPGGVSQGLGPSSSASSSRSQRPSALSLKPISAGAYTPGPPAGAEMMDARADRSARPDGGQTPTAAPVTVARETAAVEITPGQDRPGDAKATDPDWLALPDGLEVPADLPGLLQGNERLRAALERALINDSRALLQLTLEDLSHSTGGRSMAYAVRDSLAKHWPGVKLGCLAEPAQADGAPRLRAIEGGRAPTAEDERKAETYRLLRQMGL